MIKIPLALVGPSGSGKTTLANFLLSKYSNFFEFSVSSTTRTKRISEINGTDYNFITREDFLLKIQKNDFIEWAEVHGNYYGTTKQAIKDIQNRLKICLLDIDVQGIINLYNSKFVMNRICIIPKDEESIKIRLLNRKTETPESIALRIFNMKKELDIMKNHPEIFTNTIINDNLDASIESLLVIIKRMYPEIK